MPILVLLLVPLLMLAVLFLLLRSKKIRSRLLILGISFLAVLCYFLSGVAELSGFQLVFGEHNYFKAAKVFTAIVFFYWYVKRSNKNIYDHIRLLWVLFLLATFFTPNFCIPKAVVYLVNILLIYFIVLTTLRRQVKAAIHKGLGKETKAKV